MMSEPIIHDLVIADLRDRLRVGVKTYGVPLRANNGRDALWDAYEEALDLACYLKQAMVERENVRLAHSTNDASVGGGH
jgi:hypothetical protein